MIMRDIVGILFLLATTLDANGQDLPKLPDDPFYAVVEAVITRTNLTSGETIQYSAYSEEYSDYVNKRGMSLYISRSVEKRYYYDSLSNQGFVVSRSLSTPLNQATCVTVNMTDDKKPDRRFAPVNVTSFFKWSKDKAPQYIGTDTVRGIPAKVWMIKDHTDTVEGNTVMNVTYYFSDNFDTAYYGKDPTPLRIKLEGTSTNRGDHTFLHVYEFTLVAPLPPIDDNFFSTPRGVVCPNRVSPPGSVVSTPDSYSVKEEIVDRQKHTIIQSQTSMDYAMNVTRQDVTFREGSVFGNITVSIIHDFTHQLEIMMFRDNGTCKVSQLGLDPRRPSFALNWDLVPTKDGKFTLPHTRDLQIVKELQYQGVRTERGIPVDVWASLRTDGTFVNVSEIYQTRSDWSERASLPGRKFYNVQTGYHFYNYNNKTMEIKADYVSNVFDQVYGPLPEETFEAAESCYPKDILSKDHLALILLDAAGVYLKGKVTRRALTQALKAKVSSLAKVSPTRIRDVEIYDIDEHEYRAWFVLFSRLDLQDIVSSEVDSESAVVNLELALAEGSSHFLDVPTVDGGSEQILISSFLKTDDGNDLVNDDPEKALNPAKSYTAGAMAGLGIGMLILGALLALGFIGILYVKRVELNIPYLRQNE